MLLSRFDFGVAKSVKSIEENRFKKIIREKHEMEIVESLYVKGKFEDNIILWIDFGKCSAQAKFYDIKQLISNAFGGGAYLNSDEFSPEIRQFAQEIIDCYFMCFNIPQNTIKQTWLQVYDFFATVKNYAYGNASMEIKDSLSIKYQIDKNNIFVFNEPKVKIVCKNKQQYLSYIDIKSNIVDLCYNIIKKFDHYDVLTLNDITVNIMLEAELSKTMLNDYHMKQ